MIFIPIVTLACIFPSSLCALNRNLWAGIVESTEPIVSPRCLMKGALARIEAPLSCEYTRFRPFVMECKKDEEMIMVMVNEAAYTYKYAEHVSKEFLKNTDPGVDKKLRQSIKKFQSYCDHVLHLTTQKVAELMSEIPPMKLEELDHPGKTVDPEISRLSAADKTNRGIIKKTQTIWNHVSDLTQQKVSQLRARLSCYPTKYQRIENLKKCFNEIQYPQGSVPTVLSPSWKLQFEKAMFQVVEYMYKYNLIGPDELSLFYTGEEGILKAMGKHIQKRVSFTPWDLPFLHKPLNTFQIMDKSVDYLQHTLHVMEHTSKKMVYHTAFSECLHSLKTDYGFERDWPLMNELMKYLAQDSFLEHLSKWRPNPKSFDSKDILNNYVAELIRHFMDPEEYFKRSREKFKGAAYHITTQMLKYIVDNLSDNQSLRPFFIEDAAGYEEFQLKLKLLVSLDNLILFCDKEAACKDAIESGDYRFFTKNQVNITVERVHEEIQRFRKECHDILKKMKSDSNLHAWLEQKYIFEHLNMKQRYLSIHRGD